MATLSGKRHRAILTLLLACGLRRGELLKIDVEDIQQREVLPDMLGKGQRMRTVTVPAGVKARIDVWLSAAGITNGRVFRPVSKRDTVCGEEIRDEKVVWRIVARYARSVSSES